MAYRFGMHLGKRLAHARRVRGITQAKLAEAVGTIQAVVSALEKRDSKTSELLFEFADALRLNPRWLLTGQGESGLEKPWAPLELAGDEAGLLADYRAAHPSWRLSLRLLARLRTTAQPEVSESVNALLAKIAADPAPDSKLGTKWTRPDRKGKP